MNVRSVAISLYLVMLYWVSLHYPSLKTVFYPTLGAFSYLFISRSFEIRELSKVTLGAVVSSLIGCVLHSVYPGVISFLLNSLMVIWMIRKFQWNAPPILAVSLIPFFISPMAWWQIPLSVLVSLSGLLLIVGLIHYTAEYSRVFTEARLGGRLQQADKQTEGI